MLNPIEEAKFAELKDKCRELGVPAPPEIHIGFQVHDKNGVLIFDDLQRGHSWTRNYYNLLYARATSGVGSGSASFMAGYMSQKRQSGSIDNIIVGIPSSLILTIIVGTGDTAFSVEQTNLATQIADGSGAGQLSHQPMAAAVSTYTAGTKTWKTTRQRIFNNNSGGIITLKEVGILSDNYTYLVERSLLDPAVAVPVGAQLTVTYEITMDFSAID